jgi:hypothetical protein
MAHPSDVWQSSLLTAIHKFAHRPDRITARMYIEDGRACLVLVATAAVAINAWALFPSRGEPGSDVQLPTTSPPSAAVKSALDGVVGEYIRSRGDSFTLNAAERVSSKPKVYGPTAWKPSPVANVSQVSLRSKLQALLMMLYSQSGVVDPAALEAKLQALLRLPDSVLAQLMQHPDLADLNKALDAVFLGTTDLSKVKTELDKIDVTSTPGPSEKIDVVKVNGRPTYIVHSPVVQGTENATGFAVSAPPPPGAPVTVTVLFAVEAPAGLSATAFTLAPSTAELTSPPAPAGLSATAFTLAPSSAELSPPPAPAGLSATAFTLAPSSAELTPPPPSPSSFAEPTGTRQTSENVMTSGNMFEPGETATQQSADNSPATQTAAPSTPTGGGSPADAGGGDITSPSNDESGGTPSGGGMSP